MATYEIHRIENGRFFTNAITPETLIAEDIPACYMNDLNEDCSGKGHTFVYEPVPGTSGEFRTLLLQFFEMGRGLWK